MEYSKQIAEKIKNYFEKRGIDYSFYEEEGIFELSVPHKAVIRSLTYFIVIQEDAYICFAVCPIGVDPTDEKVLAEMAKFICKVNCNSHIYGHFEFDINNGEIYFNYPVFCHNENELNDNTIEESLSTPYCIYEIFAQEMVKLICGSTTAEEAYANSETRIHLILDEL